MEKLTTFNAVDYLITDEDIYCYIDAILEEECGVVFETGATPADLYAHVLRDVATALRLRAVRN
jgi:DNA-binding phage protein